MQVGKYAFLHIHPEHTMAMTKAWDVECGFRRRATGGWLTDFNFSEVDVKVASEEFVKMVIQTVHATMHD